MGMIGRILATIFGGGRNVVRDTVEVFRPNAEAQAQREYAYSRAALEQFGREFQQPLIGRKHWFDAFMDGVNRIPRPLLALGVIALFVAAMVDPTWFAARMVGLAAVPQPLWWLLGTIVAFYFGGRYQAKSQEFDLAKQVASVPLVLESQRAIEEMADDDAREVGRAKMSDSEFEEAMSSTEPLTNEVILEWNRRNNPN